MKDHEVAYNAASWEAMSNMLDAQGSTSSSIWWRWSAAALVLLLLGIGTGLYLHDGDLDAANMEIAESNDSVKVETESFAESKRETIVTEVKEELIIDDSSLKTVIQQDKEVKLEEKITETSNRTIVTNQGINKKQKVDKTIKQLEDQEAENSLVDTESARREMLAINKLECNVEEFKEDRLRKILIEEEPVKITGNRQIEYVLFNPWEQLAVVGNFDDRIIVNYQGDWTNTIGKSGDNVDLLAGRQFNMSYESVLGFDGNQGLGFYYQNSSSSELMTDNNFTAIYSYIMTNQMKGKLTISPALSFNQSNYNQVNWSEEFETDSIIPGDSSNVALSFGINYEYNRFFLYLNTYNLSSFGIGSRGNYANMSSHYVLGYHIPLSKNVTITPMISAVQNRTEMNLTPKVFVDYKERLTAGIAYFNSEQWRAYFGTRLSQRWNLQASYGMNRHVVDFGLKANGTAQLGVFYQIDAR